MANTNAKVRDMEKEDKQRLRDKLERKKPSGESVTLPFDALAEPGGKPDFVDDSGGEGGA